MWVNFHGKHEPLSVNHYDSLRVLLAYDQGKLVTPCCMWPHVYILFITPPAMHHLRCEP